MTSWQSDYCKTAVEETEVARELIRKGDKILHLTPRQLAGVQVRMNLFDDEWPTVRGGVDDEIPIR
jgi:hypothetical protein